MSANSLYYECKKSDESDDHSTASSIPWNSESIKQNKADWERVERMLQNEEPLPDGEPELRQEILDWQTKFPQLCTTNTKTKTKPKVDWILQQSTMNTSSDIQDLSSSPDDDSIEDDEDLLFQSGFLGSGRVQSKQNTKRNVSNDDERLELADVFGKDLHITPLTLGQRKSARLLEQRNPTTNFSTNDSPTMPTSKSALRYKQFTKNVLHAQKAIPQGKGHATATNNQFYMPPILNVLDTKRRFCALTGNRSFVQLTQIQQAKSARQPPAEKQFQWNRPLAAVSVNNRFLNNRNSIILPTLRHQFTTNNSAFNQSTCGGSSSRHFNSFSTTNSSVSSGDIRGRQRAHYMSNSQTTTTSSGRSISAAPMHLHGAFYHL